VRTLGDLSSTAMETCSSMDDEDEPVHGITKNVFALYTLILFSFSIYVLSQVSLPQTAYSAPCLSAFSHFI
jgi:hypothetical protein